MMMLLKLAYPQKDTRRNGNDFVLRPCKACIMFLGCLILPLKHDIGSQNILDAFRHKFALVQHALVAVTKPVHVNLISFMKIHSPM